MDSAKLQELIPNIEDPDQIRVREKNHNGFFGRIFRDSNKTLKSQNVKDHSSIVVQVLPQPEKLDNETYILFYSLRDVETKLYTQTREVKLKCKKLCDLQM